MEGSVIDTLVEASQSDLRQVLNMLSTWRLSKEAMTFEDGKQLWVYGLLSYIDAVF